MPPGPPLGGFDSGAAGSGVRPRGPAAPHGLTPPEKGRGTGDAAEGNQHLPAPRTFPPARPGGEGSLRSPVVRVFPSQPLPRAWSRPLCPQAPSVPRACPQGSRSGVGLPLRRAHDRREAWDTREPPSRRTAGSTL